MKLKTKLCRFKFKLIIKVRERKSSLLSLKMRAFSVGYWILSLLPLYQSPSSTLFGSMTCLAIFPLPFHPSPSTTRRSVLSWIMACASSRLGKKDLSLYLWRSPILGWPLVSVHWSTPPQPKVLPELSSWRIWAMGWKDHRPERTLCQVVKLGINGSLNKIILPMGNEKKG